MSLKATDENALRKFLLGRVSAEEQAELEEWLAKSNDDDYVLLEAAEDDLIDEFLNGKLKGDEREGFRIHFLAASERQSKLEFARSLERYVQSHKPALHEMPVSTGDWFVWVRYAVPALVALLIVVSAWSLVRVAAIERQLNSTIAQLADVARERDESKRLEGQYQQLEQALSGVSVSPSETLLALNLMPGPSRSAGELPTVAVNSNTRLVQFSLALPDSNFGKYAVTLSDANGGKIWTANNLDPSTSSQGAAVVVTVPGQVFSSGDYTFNVTGLSDSKPPESINSFSFRTVRQ
jgi:hypothetical protein